ncbi:MAG: pre-peptidase C-terminal domain-containing protein, partial [Deltaproteobacteria bacterium]|nr:pre-peptidase C-terminal domain-containing protein [Deltaproteobacteria bacterium]
KCNVETGRCEPPEDCANKDDDDDDGFTDCEDDECSDTTACKAAVSDACMDPGKAVDGYAGDTSKGTSLFFGSCTGSNGAKEEVLAFTSGGTPVVTRIGVTAIADLGFYVRTSCGDAASEQLCSDLYDASQPERNFLFTKANTTYDLFVDGFDANQAGKYGLALASLTTATEVEPNATTATATAATGSEGGLIGTITKGDQDYYKVTVASAGKLFVQTTGGDGTRCADGVIPAPAVDSEIEVFDVDGVTSLGLEDDISGGLFGPANFCTIVSVDLPAPGTYFVRISASQEFCTDCTFNYAAAFEFTTAPI